MQPTEHTPEELYDRYCCFFAKLAADLREIARHLPKEKAKGLLPERAGLAEFHRALTQTTACGEDPQAGMPEAA